MDPTNAKLRDGGGAFGGGVGPANGKLERDSTGMASPRGRDGEGAVTKLGVRQVLPTPVSLLPAPGSFAVLSPTPVCLLPAPGSFVVHVHLGDGSSTTIRVASA